MKSRFIYLLTCVVIATSTYPQAKLTLRKSFIDSFKNKISISSEFMVFYAHPHANAPKDDADLHIAGYDKKIGLPIVAEIMNAEDENDAVDTIHKYEGHGKPDEAIELTGAWRLWAEH